MFESLISTISPLFHCSIEDCSRSPLPAHWDSTWLQITHQKKFELHEGRPDCAALLDRTDNGAAAAEGEEDFGGMMSEDEDNTTSETQTAGELGDADVNWDVEMWDPAMKWLEQKVAGAVQLHVHV